MEKIDSLWLEDFTEEERNILENCIEKMQSIFNVSYVQAYKIIRYYEEYKGIYLYRQERDMENVRRIRLAQNDKSYTEFGKLFFEYYGIKPTENPSLYSIENSYYKKYKVCSWLDERCIIHNGRKHHLKDTAWLIYQKFGILRCQDEELYDAVWQHYKLYGNLDVGKRGRILNQVQNSTKSSENPSQ